MDIRLNCNDPTVMHIDLNSCFATIEQQANPLLRGRPVVVAAYDSPGGCVIAPSIEAKEHGIKVGMRVRDARLLYKDVAVILPDPPKYRDVYIKLCKLFREYSPGVIPRSIDEAVIDFTGTPALKQGLVDIGREIKSRIRKEIGEWISCNIGISTNCFLAKLAASLHKPDGLDVITHKNIRKVYRQLELKDLCGINTQYEARLNANGIFTPLEFFNASLEVLANQVFKSICGYYWYLRLRGWEIDAVEFKRKSFGQSYALKKPTFNSSELSKLLMKLCEKMGRRLRREGYYAKGIHVSCLYKDQTHWHKGMKVSKPLYATRDIFERAQLVLNKQSQKKRVSSLAVSCYDLVSYNAIQLQLFDNELSKTKDLADALDKINDRYGEYVIAPASMAGMQNVIIDRIAWGQSPY